MKITRYFQSCLLIEEGGVRLLIDPSAAESERIESFGKLDAVLYTHEHADHFDAELAQTFASVGAAIYANASTAKKMESQPSIVKDNQEFSVGSLKIKAMELAHCPMVDGSPGPQNTGYLIGGRLFHPGDGKELKGLQADILAVPIAGPDISLRDASDFAKQVSAKTAIPIHFDYIGTKPEVFASLGRAHSTPPYQVRVIGLGEAVEL